MKFITVPSATYELGWRFTSDLSSAAAATLATLVPPSEMVTRFSPHRKVALATFEIASTSVTFRSVLGDPYEIDGLSTIEALCDLVDTKLASDNLRLPTEDELEAAAGGTLFAWGMELPDGIPYGTGTSFVRHKEPNALGLAFAGDPYQVEICRHALKFGDGGSSICGSEPWPMAWLSLSPSFRLGNRDVAECFPETLEAAFIRPVRRG